jgi:C-terminal processing protease CtpA/Prc
MRKHSLRVTLLLLIAAATNAVLPVNPLRATDTKFATISNAQAQEMLAKIQADIQQYYYDPAFHGLDLKKRFDEASQKIATAKSQDEALLIIAAAVAALNDSHTHFRPPVRPYSVDYGWLMQAVGDSNCYVTAVRADSDAAAKGMKPGDQVLAVNGVPLLRADISTIEYSYRVFPQSGFHLDVRPPDGAARPIVAKAKITPGQATVTHTDVMAWANAHGNDRPQDPSRYHDLNKKVLVWKLPDFMVDPADVASPRRSLHFPPRAAGGSTQPAGESDLRSP